MYIDMYIYIPVAVCVGCHYWKHTNWRSLVGPVSDSKNVIVSRQDIYVIHLVGSIT